MGRCECGRLKGNPCGPLRPNTINVTMPGNVLHTELAKSADSASGFQKRADQESAYPTTRIGSPEEGLDLLAREPLDATLLALRGSQTDPLSSFRDQTLGLVVGVAAVSEKLRQEADIPGSITCFRFSHRAAQLYALRGDEQPRSGSLKASDFALWVFCEVTNPSRC